MSYPVILHVNNNKDKIVNIKEIELNEGDFLIFDITLNNFLNQLNLNDNSKYDYFTYIDEDGDYIDATNDKDLELFEECCKTSKQSVHVYIKSSRQEYDSTDEEDESLKLKLADFEQLSTIGIGQFGVVEKGYLPKRNDWIAIKRINSGEKHLEDEINNLRRCRNCSKIVEYFGASKEDGVVCIYLEYMDGKSLERYGKIPLTVLGFINVELVDALTYMWNERIWHRDLKPSNFLINSKGQVKLGDFGVARALIFSNARTTVGTAAYKAPETMRSPSYTVASDVWSYGVSIAEMAFGMPLTEFLDVHDQLDISYSIIQSMPLIIEKLIEIDDTLLLEEFVHSCLKEEPNNRTEALKLKDTTFVKTYIPVDYFCIAKFVKKFDFYKE